MDVKDLKFLKDGLGEFHGAINKIKERTFALKEGGYSKVYIHEVLRGAKRNLKVLDIASGVLLELKQQKAASESAISGRIHEIKSMN